MKWEKEIDIYEGNENERFLLGVRGSNMLLIVGLNPSYADETKPDRTMQCIQAIVRENGFDGFLMVNLYPQRTPNPSELDKEKDEMKFEKNINIIRKGIDDFNIKNILFAYGNLIEKRKYLSQTLIELREKFLSMNAWVIDFNKSGHPKHPLYSKLGKLKEWSSISDYCKKL